MRKDIKNIKVIKVFDLKEINTNDDYKFLYKSLINIKKDFDINEKIVFIHDEIEFYHRGSDVGFRIYNLFCLLNKIDISLSAICVITTNNNLEKSIASFITHENDKPLIIPVIVSEMTYNNLCKFKHIIPHNKDLEFKALCMMGTPRTHRILLRQFFQYADLLNEIEISFNDKNNLMLSPDSNIEIINDKTLSELGLVFSTTPNLNENWCIFPKFQNIKNIASTKLKTLENSKHIEPNDGEFYNQFAIDIVTETAFDYPHAFISEKTLRPLYLQKPFITVGPPKFLEYLHSCGFETFSDFWSEDYDNIEDPQERFISCTQTINYVLSLPLNQIKSMVDDMQPRLEKNRQILINYIENTYKPLYNMIYYFQN